MTCNIKLILLIVFVFINSQLSYAQNDGQKTTEQQDIYRLVGLLRDNLTKQYFDKTKAEYLSKKLKDMDNNKMFDGISVEVAAKMMTDMLRKETNDKHFNVTAYHINADNNQAVLQNAPFTAGLTSIKILKNNIGYIKWDACVGGSVSFKKLRQALDTLSGCKDLIIDITDNLGGDGAGSAFINQFFYENKDYQNLLIKKCTGETDWHQSEVTFDYKEGPVLFHIPLYIIVSGKTASAAEYFAFTAQEMKRATILGKTTAGAGNPGNGTSTIFSNSDTGFFMFIPNCQITTRAGKSIEGVGVQPDLELKTSDWVNETVKYIIKKRRTSKA